MPDEETPRWEMDGYAQEHRDSVREYWLSPEEIAVEVARLNGRLGIPLGRATPAEQAAWRAGREADKAERERALWARRRAGYEPRH